MMTLNETHKPELRSWLASANDGQTDFPIQNLPFASFKRRDSHEPFRGGVAIGDQVLDLSYLAQRGLVSGLALDAAKAASAQTLNALMSMGLETWSALRLAL